MIYYLKSNDLSSLFPKEGVTQIKCRSIENLSLCCVALSSGEEALSVAVAFSVAFAFF
jgi:hypothetical protein